MDENNLSEQVQPILNNKLAQKDKKRPITIFFISAFIHSILILITILIIVSTTKPTSEDIIISTQILEEPEEK